jgi:hypothetical protein
VQEKLNQPWHAVQRAAPQTSLKRQASTLEVCVRNVNVSERCSRDRLRPFSRLNTDPGRGRRAGSTVRGADDRHRRPSGISSPYDEGLQAKLSAFRIIAVQKRSLIRRQYMLGKERPNAIVK